LGEEFSLDPNSGVFYSQLYDFSKHAYNVPIEMHLEEYFNQPILL
jgi:hypothetical protein